MNTTDQNQTAPPAIRPEFQFHNLNETDVERVLPAGRERSLVVTKLQEACRWAVAGAAALPAHQLDAAK